VAVLCIRRDSLSVILLFAGLFPLARGAGRWLALMSLVSGHHGGDCTVAAPRR
jgi:hypothetical protein